MKGIIEEMRAYATDRADEGLWKVANYIRLIADRLESMQPAAGPWQTDVENAPKDKWIAVLAKTGEYSVVMYNSLFDCWHCEPEYLICQHQMEAFAELNPYQPEDAAHE